MKSEQGWRGGAAETGLLPLSR